MSMRKKQLSLLSILWICNLILLITYLIGGQSISFLKSSVLEYNNVTSDPFDGTVSPIAYIPDWSKSENTNKARLFESFSVADFVEIPEYDSELLSDNLQQTANVILSRYTYPVVYMGSYRGNYIEYDGSHPAVDIRAPIGTPVVSVANGVVIKVKNTDTGDGKYVIIRHDNIDVNGVKETLYSGYEHLSEIVAVEGTKIRRGDVLGKVGMTGITTTPHLHFQIDKSTSPFHIYWPYTFQDAADLGLDFFGAINVGLGKENAIRYTINPMDFIKNNRFLGSAPQERNIATVVKQEPLVISSQIVADTTVPDNGNIITVVPKSKNSIIPEVIPQSEVITSRVNTSPRFTADTTHIFSDISINSPFYSSTKYLSDAGVIQGYPDGGFHSSEYVSR
jgi:murein DD-endopeptidase MepM/ murein hydrolase activator NlpD